MNNKLGVCFVLLACFLVSCNEKEHSSRTKKIDSIDNTSVRNVHKTDEDTDSCCTDLINVLKKYEPKDFKLILFEDMQKSTIDNLFSNCSVNCELVMIEFNKVLMKLLYYQLKYARQTYNLLATTGHYELFLINNYIDYFQLRKNEPYYKTSVCIFVAQDFLEDDTEMKMLCNEIDILSNQLFKNDKIE